MLRDLFRHGLMRAATVLVLLTLLVACGGTPATPTAPPEESVASEVPTSESAPATSVPPPGVPTAPAPSTAAVASAPPSATARATATSGVRSTTPSAVAPAVATAQRPVTTSALATHRLVTYYGHPYDDRMGILGEYDPEPMVQKLKEQTAAYTAADPSRPGLCTIELIASVAQGSPGADGLYIARTPKAEIEKFAQLAEKHGCLLMLDIQMGYDTIQNDVNPLLPFLKLPYVHLAIDPEFHVARGEIPGESYGSVSAAEVAWAMQTLGDLVRANNLPDKIVILHQFRADMLPEKDQIKPMPNIDIVVMMDGWGLPTAKTANYNLFVREELIQYGGIKLFYRQDNPLMTPQEVVKLDPPPLIVIYQ
ncbi:MAG: hypothetical protein AVDCRST_MAG18-178 [uncultured Thermomicrobiales bacterium]|uniref:Lipoprotein n=1 Tax=uncultured Thermomicrobiales bacterium TaxID=1645740 RepID=A0A6J4UJ61_9BACT|nr:MAG: hypothetical protein AVDCRST_MAG18-178 [uncultured Thermomicrobiales bacterium]